MIKLIQNKTKKGDTYYICKADQSGTLNVTDGRYCVKTDKDVQIGMLSLSLQPAAAGDIEVLKFEDRKIVPTDPYEWPLTVHIKCDFTNGTAQEKAIHKLFTNPDKLYESKANGDTPSASYTGIDMASGFAGEISWADTPGAKRIASSEGVKSHDWQSLADIVKITSAIEDKDIPGVSTGNAYGGGGGIKAQTEAEKIADRLAYLTKACTSELPEGVQLEQLAKDLSVDKYVVVQILFS